MIRISSKTVARILEVDALFIMAFCLWWAYSAGNASISLIGIMASFALLDLSRRARGEEPFPVYFAFVAWAFLVIVALSLVLASLGLAIDAFGLLTK